jgi:hypothetical protein
MLPTLLNVFTDGERRFCMGLGPGWARCCVWNCMGKVFDEVVRDRECP